MKRVFHDRAIVDIPNDDRIFHTIYNLDETCSKCRKRRLGAGP
jgi:hypothetical protein